MLLFQLEESIKRKKAIVLETKSIALDIPIINKINNH